jgi:hypothetical protein
MSPQSKTRTSKETMSMYEYEPPEQDSDEQGDDEFEQSKRKALAQEEAASDWI